MLQGLTYRQAIAKLNHPDITEARFELYLHFLNGRDATLDDDIRYMDFGLILEFILNRDVE